MVRQLRRGLRHLHQHGNSENSLCYSYKIKKKQFYRSPPTKISRTRTTSRPKPTTARLTDATTSRPKPTTARLTDATTSRPKPTTARLTDATTSRPKPTTTRLTDATTSRPSNGMTTWSAAGVSYNAGDIVSYKGVRYQCVYNHVSFPGAEPGVLTWAWWQRID